MKPETAARMNELGRMTPEERRRSQVSEVFAPLLDAMLPAKPAEDKPDVEDAA